MATLEEKLLELDPDYNLGTLQKTAPVPVRPEVVEGSLEQKLRMLQGDVELPQTVHKLPEFPSLPLATSTGQNQIDQFNSLFPDGVDELDLETFLAKQNAIGEINPNIDLGSGLDTTIGVGESLPIRAGLSFDDTTLEENARLEESFGREGEGFNDGGWFRDAKGTVFVNPEGLVYGGYEDKRPENIRDRAFRLDELGMSTGDLADITSDAIDIGVPVATAIVSGGSGIPASFLRAWNVMRVSGATKGATELAEELAGINQQSAPEVMRNIGMYTVETGLFELGGTAVNAIFRRVLTGLKTTRKSLPPKTLTEIYNDLAKGRFKVAWTKLPKNIQEEVVKGITRGVERSKGITGAIVKGGKEAVGGVKKGFEKSIDNTKFKWGEVGDLKQVASQKQVRLTDEIRKFGGKPKLDRATKAPLWSKLQTFADFVTGQRTRRTAINVRAISRKKAELEKQAGGGKRIVNRKITIRDAKAKAQKAVRGAERFAKTSGRILEDNLKRADVAISRSIENAVSTLKATVGKSGQAGANIKKGIIRAKDTFSTRARSFANSIDDIAGGKPIINMNNTKKAIKNILDRGIKTEDGKSIQIRGEGKKWLEDVLKSGNNRQTFKSMTEFLSEMTHAGYNPQLVADITTHNANAIKTAILKDMSNSVLGQSKQAVPKWLQFRRWYKHQIRKFDDVAISDLVRDIRVGGLEASKIIPRINSVKSVEQIAKIKRALRDPELPYAKQNVWESAKKEILDIEIAKATDKSGMFNPSLFLRNILEKDGGGKKGAGRVFTAIFDKDAKEIMRMAKELSHSNQTFKLPTKDAKAVIRDLSPGEFKVAMQEKLIQVAIKNSKFKAKDGTKKVIEAIAKGDDDVAKYLMQTTKTPDDAVKQIREAREFYGKDSKEWEAIKFSSAKTILNKIIQNTDDPLERIISGSELKAEVTAVKKQIIEMFGEKTWKQWDEFADMSANVSKKIETKGNSGTIAVAYIPLHPIANLGKIGQLNFLGRLFISGDGLTYFTRGFTKGIGSPFMRKTGTLTAKTSAQAMATEFNKIITKIWTENKEDFKSEMKIDLMGLREKLKSEYQKKE